MSNRRKLGELLVAAGVLDQTRLDAALAEQRKWGGKLGRLLIELGFVDEALMVKALSRQLQLPAVDFRKDLPSADAISRMPVQLCEKYGVFPIAFDEAHRTLTVATSDPTNETALRELRLELKLREVKPAVAGAVDVDRAVRHYYYGERTTPVPTATPQHFGLSEQLIELGVPSAGIIPGREPPMSDASREITAPLIPAPTAIPVQPQPYARTPTPVPGDLIRPTPAPVQRPGSQGTPTPAPMRAVEQNPEQLLALVQRMETLLAAEVRSLRVLVELLVEKGLISREEYLRRMKER